MEAELISANEGGKEVAWMQKLTYDLGETGTNSQLSATLFMPDLFCDNQGAIDIMKTPRLNKRSKHIDVRYMWLRRDIVEKGKLRIIHIPGKEQPADMLTKQLPVVAFRKHSAALGLTGFDDQERKEVGDQSAVRSEKQQ